jgi:hypothetical protein
MNRWLDISLVTAAVLASAAYAIYALGPKRIKSFYSRFATKYFGLRAARWFAPSSGGHDCNDCSSKTSHEKLRF